MPSFLPGAYWFAIAGALAAAGPVVIHLLNRRRFRTIEWGAMELLLEALSRSRRMLHLRDVLLLLLRCAALALFGLALARPYFSSSASTASPNAPVHAVLVVDNSLSMGYEHLGGARMLDAAKAQANEFIGQLPPGSRVSVLPLCGAPGGISLDAYRSLDDARDAVNQVELTDRSSSVVQAAELAGEALRQVSDLPNKRVVFISDQQTINWPGETAKSAVAALPDLQVVSVGAATVENTWVDSFELEDGVADVETPARFVCVIRHEGAEPRPNVPVALVIDGVEVASELISLEPGQRRELAFTYRFDAPPEVGKPQWVSAQVSLPADRLPADDFRCLVAPVVAAVPVVFVDQLGAAQEDPKHNRMGETRPLRRLLVPAALRADAGKQLVAVRHVKIDQLDRELLADARLVVIAGVRSPEGVTPLLVEFVRQGGQLVIVAGGDFDLDAWQRHGWQEGSGILPLPLRGLEGKLPDEPGELRPFFLSYPSLRDHEFFQLTGVPEEEQADLYGQPLFFKAVAADARPETLEAWLTAETQRRAATTGDQQRLEERIAELNELESKGQLTASQRTERGELLAQGERLQPGWLTWPESDVAPANDASPADLAEQQRPRVIARFDNNVPFMAVRPIGRGQVLWVASGLDGNWNTLPRTNAMLIFDRALRGMLQQTLPRRNLTAGQSLLLPVANVERSATVQLVSPEGAAMPLSIDALGGQRYGVAVNSLQQRGVYHVVASRETTANANTLDRVLWNEPLAVNGPGRESEPAILNAATFADKFGGLTNVRWIDRGEPIRLEGALVRGQNMWWWLLLGVAGCLLAEQMILAAPAWKQK